MRNASIASAGLTRGSTASLARRHTGTRARRHTVRLQNPPGPLLTLVNPCLRRLSRAALVLALADPSKEPALRGLRALCSRHPFLPGSALESRRR